VSHRVNRIAASSIAAFMALTTWPVPAAAGFADSELFLPAVGAAPGVPPAVWTTTVWVHNPTATRADVTFALLERRPNPAPLTFTDSIPPGDTRRYDDAVESMFDVETFGAIRIASNVEIVVSSRISSQPGDSIKDSSGQFFAAVPASFAIATGESTEIVGGWQTRPPTDSPFRFNFGLLETTGSGTCEVEVAAKDETGATLASKRYTIGQWEQLQKAFANEFPGVSSANVRLTVTVLSGKGRVIAFGSSVSNGLQDPSTLEMRYADGLLAANSGAGTITGVIAGDGLAGGGTTGNVTLDIGAGDGIAVAANAVSIADEGVTPAKISTAGGGTGDVLTVTPSGATWQAVSGGAGGDITAVQAGPGLSGGGTSGEVTLSIPNGGVTGAMFQDASVTAAKISPAGGSSGQILKHTGTAVAWAEDQGFAVPIYSIGSTSQALLGLENTASGNAIFAASAGGIAIEGVAPSTSGVGVKGWANGTAAVGVLGVQFHGGTTGELATSSVGARGEHNATGNYGYLGSTDYGVLGRRGDDSAVGYFASEHGVYGRCSVGGGRYAGYFNGPVRVNGTLSKSGGSFVIDHPLDPENRTLSHSFVESPDMMNIYNGNVVTDADGTATVALPDWFEALNRDFRYQLTVIGQFAQAIVAREIEDNSFVIRTDRGNVKVSWQVTGIRHDRWAEAHRIPVEEDKPDDERGTYLAPEDWDQPRELGLEWRQEASLRGDHEPRHRDPAELN